MEHGIDCKCKECLKVKKLLKEKSKSGEVHLVGTKEDLQKLEDGKI